jgi:hypothetical protein
MVKVRFEREVEDCFYCPFCRNDNEYNGWVCQEIKIPYYWIKIGQIDEKCPFRKDEEN